MTVTPEQEKRLRDDFANEGRLWPLMQMALSDAEFVVNQSWDGPDGTVVDVDLMMNKWFYAEHLPENDGCADEDKRYSCSVCLGGAVLLNRGWLKFDRPGDVTGYSEYAYRGLLQPRGTDVRVPPVPDSYQDRVERRVEAVDSIRKGDVTEALCLMTGCDMDERRPPMDVVLEEYFKCSLGKHEFRRKHRAVRAAENAITGADHVENPFNDLHTRVGESEMSYAAGWWRDKGVPMLMRIESA